MVFFENSPSTELSTERLMEDFKLVVLEKYQFENRDLKLKITFLAISACQYWYPKNTLIFKRFSPVKNLLIDTFAVGLKQVVLRKKNVSCEMCQYYQQFLASSQCKAAERKKINKFL